MSRTRTRPRSSFLTLALAVALVATLAVPATARPGPPSQTPNRPAEVTPPHAQGRPTAPGAPHEVWMLDQGTDEALVFNEHRQRVARVDLSKDALLAYGYPEAGSDTVVPHMIDFDSEHRYAFIAATAGAATIVVDARAKRVVTVLPTGAGSHMAAVTPDDSAVWVAAIGARQMVRVDLDLDAEPPTFELGDPDDAAFAVEDLLANYEEAGGDEHDWPSHSPVCHQYVENDDRIEAWVTLGPGALQGGLFVLDVTDGNDPQVTAAFDPRSVKANCGVAVTADGTRVFANWSGDIRPADGTYLAEDPQGEWYVFDTETYEELDRGSSEGIDAHGVRLTPDGDALWMVNRGTGDGLVLDPGDPANDGPYQVTHVWDEGDLGDTPDILDFSPDGRFAYVTQRGPIPLSGAAHVATGEDPGILVVDTRTRRAVDRLEPRHTVGIRETNSGPVDGVLNDVHGVGVRPTGETTRPGQRLGPPDRVRVAIAPEAGRAVSSTPAADVLSIHCRI